MEKSYLAQLCEFYLELDAQRISINSLPEHQKKNLRKLRESAKRQTDLTWEELGIIVNFRRWRSVHWDK